MDTGLLHARPSSIALPDLVAYLPCPVKVPFEQALEEYLEGNANKNEADYAALIGAHRAEDLPSLLITPGVNELFGGRFIRQVLDSGHFVDVASYPRDPGFSGSALRDPLGHATVLAANVTLIVVDFGQLGSRPVPHRWADLLMPEFRNSVIMRGNGKRFCETTLLAWHHLFGQNGLECIGRAVREGWHPGY